MGKSQTNKLTDRKAQPLKDSPRLSPMPRILCSDLAHLGSCSFVLLYFAKARMPSENKRLLFVCLHSINGSMVTNTGALPGVLVARSWDTGRRQGVLLHQKIQCTRYRLLFHINSGKTHISLVRLDPDILLTPEDTIYTHFQSLQLPSRSFFLLSRC